MPLSSRGGYTKRDDTTGCQFGGSEFTVRLARTSAVHDAGTLQAVNLCDDDFVELDPERQVSAFNDSLVLIPDDTKVYIARFAGKMRIIQAFICEEE